MLVKQIHVIPVPRHMSVDEAASEIRLFDRLLPENVDSQCKWAVVEEWVQEDVVWA